MISLIVSHRTFKRRALAVGLGIAFCAAFLACYVLTIVPAFYYQGFTIKLLPTWCWVVSFALAVLPLLWMPVTISRPSDFASWFLYLCVVAPTSLLCFSFADWNPAEMLPLPVMLVASFGLFEICRRGRFIDVPEVRNMDRLFCVGLPLLMVVVSVLVFALAGFKIDFSINEAYDRRMVAREVVPGGTLMAYAVSFLIGVCLPVSIGMIGTLKKWFLVPVTLLAITAVFSLSGQKFVIFAPLLLVYTMLLAKHRRLTAGYWLAAAFLLGAVLAVAEVYIAGSDVISNLLVRRQVAMPAQLTTYYWTFFSSPGHPHVMMSDGILRHFIAAPYQLETPRLIGQYYFGDAEANANANIWAAGFAHFGYIGMLLVSVVGALIMRIADSLAVRGRFLSGCITCAMIGMVWTNGALHTSILSNGVLLLLIALWIFPKTAADRQPGSTAVPQISTGPSHL